MVCFTPSVRRLFLSCHPQLFGIARHNVQNPSNTFLLMDTVNSASRSSGYYYVYDSSHATRYPDARHQKAVNVLWADGHGSSIGVSDRDNPYVDLTDWYADPNDN